MITHITLTQFDMLEGTQTVIADCQGTYDGDALIYHEMNDPDIIHEVIFSEDEVVLKRKGGFGSVTRLYPDKKGESRVHSPYGIMRLETLMMRREKSEDRWSVEYMIRGNGEVLTHQSLVWEMKGVSE